MAAELPPYIVEEIGRLAGEQDATVLEIVRRGHTNSTVLEVIVDSVSGLSLDLVAKISRGVSDLLDDEENEGVIRGRYRLEVTTPGLDRPLEHPWQYTKNIGRLVKTSWRDEEGKKSTALYRLLGAADGGLQVQPLKAKGKAKAQPSGDPITIPFSNLERVVVEPEL